VNRKYLYLFHTNVFDCLFKRETSNHDIKLPEQNVTMDTCAQGNMFL